jgi:hypothetical protein
MEELIKNDATFEVYHNSEGGQLLNNRVLLSYPSEKSSFDVFLGFEGEEPTTKTDATKTKPTYDPEKIAQGVTATAGAISSIGSTIQAFKGDGTKAPSRRKALKEVCGRKPTLKKNRGTYDKCVADYNAGKLGGATTRMAEPPPTETKTEETPPPNNTKKIVIGLVVVGVLVTAFIGYKKGWFGKKAG